MDSAAKKDIAQLRLYLNSLSNSIPVPKPGESQYDFQHFAPDPEWVEDIGEEHAVNRELEVRLGSRANGPVELKEKGPSISSLADILEKYLTQYPNSVLIRKWLVDILESATLVFVPCHGEVCQRTMLKRVLTFII